MSDSLFISWMELRTLFLDYKFSIKIYKVKTCGFAHRDGLNNCLYSNIGIQEWLIIQKALEILRILIVDSRFKRSLDVSVGEIWHAAGEQGEDQVDDGTSGCKKQVQHL
jgi:hypothetical protein